MNTNNKIIYQNTWPKKQSQIREKFFPKFQKPLVIMKVLPGFMPIEGLLSGMPTEKS